MGKLKLALAAVGLALFTYLVYSAGPREIAAEIWGLGFSALYILPPYFIVYVLDNYGFYYAFESRPAGGAGYWQLFTARLAGDAVNYSTPTAYLGGEPVKAGILRNYNIPLKEGLSAVIVGKTTMTMAQVVFIVIGLGLAITVLGSSSVLVESATMVLFVAFIIIAFMYWVQRKGMFGLLLKLLRALRIRSKYIEAREEKLLKLDESISRFYTKRHLWFLASLFFNLAGWLAGALEVWVLCWLIDVEIGLIDAVVIEMFIQTIKAVMFFMPANLGTQEVGNVLIFAAFGFDSKSAMSFSILRRAREILWAAAGFYFLGKLAPTSGEEVLDESGQA